MIDPSLLCRLYAPLAILGPAQRAIFVEEDDPALLIGLATYAWKANPTSGALECPGSFSFSLTGAIPRQHA